jgi:hypothetical protein
MGNLCFASLGEGQESASSAGGQESASSCVGGQESASCIGDQESASAATRVDPDLIREKFPSLADAPEFDLIFAGILNRIVPPLGLLTLRSAINHAPAGTFDYANSKIPKTISVLAWYGGVKNISEFLGSASIKNWGPEQKEAWFVENADYIKSAIFDFVNQFANLIRGEIGFSRADVNTVFDLLKKIVLDYDSITEGNCFPAIQLSPTFGAYHDKIMSNIIKRAINIFLTVFRLNHVRVNCTNAVKEKASFVTREQGGYCSTCAYSYDKTTFERSASYPKTQSGIKMLLYAAPHNSKHSSKKMRDHMITNPTHKFLTNGPLLDDSKYDIVFANTGMYFLGSHNLCKKPIVFTLFYCGSISISYNMAWAAIMLAIDPRDHQARLLKLHSSR